MGDKKYKKMERIIIDKENIDYIEEDIIIRRGIERYMYVRQFVYGNILDAACGVGYGSYLLSKNPDVKSIVSVDRDKDAIKNANENFKRDNIKFLCSELSEIDGKFDMLVSLETIEHLPEPKILKELIDKIGVNEIVLSFPSKKTTHYNKYHIWDFDESDIMRILDNFQCYKTHEIGDSIIMNFIRIERDMSKKNLYK